MNWLKGLISLLLVSLLVGCSGGGVSGLFTEQEKNFVYGLFKSEYLWYDEVAEDVDLTSYYRATSSSRSTQSHSTR